MNTDNKLPLPADTPIPAVITLEEIAKRKAGKKEQIEKSKERMMKITHDLFVPAKPQNNFEGIMQNINAGIAAYDGLMTGIRIFRRIRSFFAFTGYRRKRK